MGYSFGVLGTLNLFLLLLILKMPPIVECGYLICQFLHKHAKLYTKSFGEVLQNVLGVCVYGMFLMRFQHGLDAKHTYQIATSETGAV